MFSFSPRSFLVLPCTLLAAQPAFAQAPAAPPPAAESPPSAPVAEPAPPPTPAPEVAPPPVATAATPPPPAVEPEAPAPSLLPVKLGTDVWSRFEVRENYDKLGVSRGRFQEGDETFFRARLTLESNALQLTDGATGLVYFAPQATGIWGTQGLGGTVGEASLGIYEAYFKLATPSLAVKAGRFALNYGDALVIGNLDWHQSGRAFDGAHLRYSFGKASVDAFVTQLSDGWPGLNKTFLIGDNYFWGLYGQFGELLAEGLALDVYALGKSAAATDVPVDPTDPTLGTAHVDGATFVTLGARAKQKLDAFDYRIEAGLQVGKTPARSAPLNKLAYQADVEAGYAPVKGFHLALNGAIASGDGDATDDADNAWDELYPTTHKWFGLTDVIGLRTNVMSLNLKLSGNVTASTTATLDAHVFARPQSNGLGRAPDANSDLAGYELDAQLIQKIGKYAGVRGLYCVFIPNKDYYGSDKLAHFFELQAGLKF